MKKSTKNNSVNGRGHYFARSDQGADLGLGCFPGRCAKTSFLTICYYPNGKPNGENIEPGISFEVLKSIRIKRRRFAFIEVNGKTKIISVGDITG